MTHSLVYRVYKALEKVYVNSKTIKGFAGCMDSWFNILINSKTFRGMVGDRELDIFRESALFKIGNKSFEKAIDRVNHKNWVKIICENSYFFNWFVGAMDEKDNHAIHQLSLVGALALFFNVSIKMAAGNFLFRSNIILIVATILLILLYTLKLDYKNILRESKVIRLLYDVINDESSPNEF